MCVCVWRDRVLENHVESIVIEIQASRHNCWADIESREKSMDHVMHLINIDIQDNHEEATIGAFMICELVTMVSRPFLA